MSDRYESPSPRHYIIVVHGIGEQRHNETTVEVVNRFATARAKEKPISSYEALLPGSLSSLSVRRKGGGQGWSEFEGIRVDSADKSEPFDGTRATGEAVGRNFRFVDMRWADILQDHHRVFSSSTKQWTGSLLARLKPPFTQNPVSETWVMPLLEEMMETLLPIQGLLKWYAPEVEKTIYQDVIGDIHLYGDYTRTRGQAVRRFHAQLDQIHLRDYIQWCRFERTSRDEPYVPPVYTIIAHSLGSVLSFDALVYAFAKDSIREGNGRHDSGSLPFPGYTEQEDSEHESWLGLLSDLRKPPHDSRLPYPQENWAGLGACYAQFRKSYGIRPPSTDAPPAGDLPLLLWRDHVKHFITLGSPIDKFVVLWHHNYRHMGPNYSAKDAWSEGWLDDTITHRIIHYNVCDEQDPVGHHLDVARHCAAYNNVFRTDLPVAYRDVVFRRYAVPGLAHVQYWKDQELFDRLIREVIDERPAPQAVQVSSDSNSHLGQLIDEQFFEVAGVYDTALAWAYARVPLIASVTAGVLLSYGWIGWYYWGFSPSCILALLAGILLWSCPRPLEAYRQEVQTEHVAQKNPLIKRLLPWKFHRGILANVVAGAVAWRRILISLNDHPNPATKKSDAEKNQIRLSLETAGNFRSVFRNRIIGGTLVFLIAAAGTWCGRMYLGVAADRLARPPWWYVTILTLTTVSTVYLITMGYVAYIFVCKKKAIPTTSGSKHEAPSLLGNRLPESRSAEMTAPLTCGACRDPRQGFS